jgi:putative glutamine amidotransferase
MDRKMIGPHPFHAVGDKYLRALVEGADVVPVPLPSWAPRFDAAPLLAQLDGLLFPGSPSNIAPEHYPDGATWPGNLHDPDRDATTLPLIGEAIAAGLPVLAICRGMQEVNVALGGSLHPKIHEVAGLDDHRESHADPLDVQYGPAHKVRLSAGGLLHRLAGRAEVEVNSLHGQGVARLGRGLVVEAIAPDGVIEAIRLDAPDPFLLGVQWHPEWRVRENPLSLAIFQAFGEACRAHLRHRNP